MKTIMVTDEAYERLARRKQAGESFTDVVLRLTPPVIETFGDLEKHLGMFDGPVFDPGCLSELRRRKQNPKPSPRRASRAH